MRNTRFGPWVNWNGVWYILEKDGKSADIRWYVTAKTWVRKNKMREIKEEHI